MSDTVFPVISSRVFHFEYAPSVWKPLIFIGEESPAPPTRLAPK